MLQGAFAAGVPAAWVTGESVYGEERRRRGWWAEQDHAYGLAVSGQEDGGRAGQQQQVQTMLATLRPAGWSRLRAGAGAQGPRWDDWTWLPRVAPLQPAWRRGLLVCRRVSDPTALPAYIVFAPQERTLATVVPVAGRRWTVAQGCAEAKGAGGLEHDEVRSWTGWYRHITLAMWVYALLTVLRAAHLPTEEAPKKTLPQRTPSSLAAFKAARGLLCH